MSDDEQNSTAIEEKDERDYNDDDDDDDDDHHHGEDDNSDSNNSDYDDDDDDDDESYQSSELSDSIKYRLIRNVDAMKAFLRMHRVRRSTGASPLLDISDCIDELSSSGSGNGGGGGDDDNARRLQLFGKALREDVELEAIDLCIDSLPNQVAKDIAIFFGKSPTLVSLDLNHSSTSSRRNATSKQGQSQGDTEEAPKGDTATLTPDHGTDLKMVRLFLHTFLRNPRARDVALWDIVTVPSTLPLPDITKLLSTASSLRTIKCCDCSVNLAKAMLQGIILLQTAVEHVEFVVDNNWSSTTTNNNDATAAAAAAATREEIKELSRLFQLLVTSCTSLRTLRLDSVPGLPALMSVAAGAAVLPHLDFLELVIVMPSINESHQDNNKTKAMQLLATIVSRTTSIKRLDVHGLDWENGRTQIFADALQTNRTIEKLRLTGPGAHHILMSDSILQELHPQQQDTPKLREIDLTENDFTNLSPEGLQQTIAQKNTGLHDLRLPTLNDAQFCALLRSLQQNNSIQCIHVSLSQTLSQGSAQQLREMLQSNTSLRHWVLEALYDDWSKNNDGNEEEGTDSPHLVDVFATALENDGSHLQSLHLTGNTRHTSASSVGLLFSALHNNTMLRELNLAGLDVVGTLHVCHHLPHVSHLEVLRLRIPEDFDEEHHDDAFGAALEANESLKKLSVLYDDSSKLESVAEPFILRNRIKWMFGAVERKPLWPAMLWQYDESTMFQWVAAWSDHLVTISNKRKSATEAT